MKLRLAKDITTESVTLSKGENGKSTKMDAESVSVNNGSQHTTVNAGGISVNSNNQAPVSLTSRGLDNGGNRISNVADGVQPHDAVNVSQLNRVKKKWKNIPMPVPQQRLQSVIYRTQCTAVNQWWQLPAAATAVNLRWQSGYLIQTKKAT
ncbi:hypothetical protein INT80_05150 [Gallibacterium anatis]|uniref:Trimeric autotransporter adhesin YadA-like stalk domain-containing protein n=1 Tax=Gallibacterium anatis TaxID=750 RepID=A0A930Y8I6_9PAST|nr:hypothetical protein [Gallibacterium anatis]